MAEHTNISWCDHTFNGWIGCQRVSPACDSCYAEAMMDRRYGRVKWGGPGKGSGTRERTSAANWAKPKAWNRKAEKAASRPFVFCSSLADVFDNQVPVEWRKDLFDLIRDTPNLVWLLLTKRPQLISRLSMDAGGLPPNAAIGVTIEDQIRADINEPALVMAAAEVDPLFTFISCEPLLEYVKLRHIEDGKIHWIISGGETDQGGNKARPSNPDWFRCLRDECRRANIPYHHKQNGEWAEYYQIGASGWTFTKEKDGIRYGKLRSGDFRCRAEMFGGKEFETRYPWSQSHNNPCMVKVGKRIAGRMLDRVIHNDRPRI